MSHQNINIDQYIELITKFVTKKINSSQFETLYLDLFKPDGRTFPLNELSVLSKLFTDVDAFCGDNDLRGEDDIDEDELLKCANQALVELNKSLE